MKATLRVFDPEGRVASVAFVAPQTTIGRAPDNTLVLDHAGGGVSSHHCVLSFDPTRGFALHDRGSTNGTWIDGCQIVDVVPIQPGMRIAVGAYQIALELEMKGTPASPPLLAPAGPLLAKREDELIARRFRDSIARAAAEWDRKGRPRKLLLTRSELARVEQLHEGGDVQPLDDIERGYVRASRARLERDQNVKVGATVGGSATALALGLWLVLRVSSSEPTTAPAVAEITRQDAGERVLPETPRASGVERQKEWVEHVVIPAETLEDIALRYGVDIQSLSRWNGVGEREVLEPGRIIRVKAENPPLPWQQITYQPETSESWSSLARRFDVPVDKLRAYNPSVGEKITASDELTIWITPKPLRKGGNIEIPTYPIDKDAISIGAPHDGRIENAIRFPENEELYKRRAPNIMWCGSYMAENLQLAIATFRKTYEFEGDIVVADMSKQTGGPFEPHKSHQAGRDVDVWLPTLKGVYKRDHLDKERRPFPDEVDWFALYGFLQALEQTESVHAVFLAWELHEKVYDAAKLMGASDEELHEMITWPRGPNSREALLQHSDGHTRHMHIRFKCGPKDRDCSNTVRAHDAGD